MRLSGKHAVAIAVVVALFLCNNIVFAFFYMTKPLKLTGGVRAAEGGIEIYDEDGMTPLGDFDFPMFPAGVEGTYYKRFFVNNTGDLPVYVHWNISTSSIDWEVITDGDWGEHYAHFEDVSLIKDVLKYQFGIVIGWTEPYDYHDMWPPNSIYLILLPGMGRQFQLRLRYSGSPETVEKLKMKVEFHAGEWIPPED